MRSWRVTSRGSDPEITRAASKANSYQLFLSVGAGDPQGGGLLHNHKASDGRLVRPTLRGALLGLEIGTRQSTLPVGAGRYGKTPYIALSGAFLALRASDCNDWPRRWVRDDGRIGTQEEPAVFRRNNRVLRVLRDSGPQPGIVPGIN